MANSTARLPGKRVLITGASSGVGLDAVRRFAAEGAQLALVARRGEALSRTLRAEGIDAVVLTADLGDREAARQAVDDAAAALGGLDIVVSNAAAAVLGHTLEIHPDDFDRAVAVTFTGAVDVIRQALPHLRRSQGVVVATGSLMARLPLPTWGSYSAAKHALRGFLNTLRVEEREQRTGVRVAMVHPGAVDTPLWAHSSSGTGRSPRVPPDAYRPEVLGQALVEAAVRPRAEIVVGGETRVMDLLYSVARPLGERILVVIDRWYRSSDQDAPRPGSLWQAPATVQLSGGIPSRDSLFAPVQLGRRMLPSPVTPLRLTRNLVAAAVRAAQLAPRLSRPTPEQPPPARSMREMREAAEAPAGTRTVAV